MQISLLRRQLEDDWPSDDCAFCCPVFSQAFLISDGLLTLHFSPTRWSAWRIFLFFPSPLTLPRVMLELRDTLCFSVGQLATRRKWVSFYPKKRTSNSRKKNIRICLRGNLVIKRVAERKKKDIFSFLKFIVLTSMKGQNKKALLQERERKKKDFVTRDNFFFLPWFVNAALQCYIKNHE